MGSEGLMRSRRHIPNTFSGTCIVCGAEVEDVESAKAKDCITSKLERTDKVKAHFQATRQKQLVRLDEQERYALRLV